MATDILIVDDEKDICDLIAGILNDEGFETRQAISSERALEEVQRRTPSLVILDVWLQGSAMDGLAVLRYLKSVDESLPVIVISGHGNFDTALTAINSGAYDYLEKPFKTDQLLLVIERAIELTKLKNENKVLKHQRITHEAWVGEGINAIKTRAAIEKLASTNSRVLINGAKGTGKRLAARLIHQSSSRRDGPFVVIENSALEGRHLETELFGAEAHEGKVQKVGLFEKAHKGTIVLSCLPDLPLDIQREVLRILTDFSFSRRYGESSVTIDVRVITTAIEPLEAYVENGQLLEDLYARLDVSRLDIAPVSNRISDIPQLVEYFVLEVATKTGLNVRKFSDEALGVLQTMSWPGNIRQLRNFVERILILSPNDITSKISVDELSYDSVGEIGQMPQLVGDYSDIIGLTLRDAREQFERNYLRLQILRFNGNVSKTAEFIGMERSALHRKIKSLGIKTQ